MRQAAAALAALVLLAAPAAGEGLTLSSKNRASLFSAQIGVLDGRAAEQYAASARLQPKKPMLDLGRSPAFTGRYKGEWLETARAAARRHAVPEDLFLRLVQQESGWNPGARSHKGAIGLAQLMPTTAARLGVDPHDPRQNLEGGARYLRAQYERFGSWRLALAAYNAGPEAVTRHGGVPPYAETTKYVRVIWGS